MKLSSRWPIVPLGDVVEATQYGTSLKANEEGLGVPVLRMNNITYSGTIDLTDLKHVELPIEDLRQYSVLRGDLLFNRTNSQQLVGKMGFWNRDDQYAFAGYLIRLRLKRNMAEPAFIAAWFNTPGIKALLRTRAKPSINMANINATEVLDFPVVLPPLAEQRRIAEVLDRAEALRAKRRAALAQLDSLTQAIFLDMFGDPSTNPKGWKIAHVGDTAEVQGGLQVSVSRNNHPREAPYLRVANVFRGFLDLGDVKTLRATDAEISRTMLAKDDLLIVEGHGNPGEIGRGALWDGSVDGCVHQNHLIRVRFDTVQILPLYACMYLNSPGGRRHLLRAGKTTSGLNTISVSLVSG